MSSSHTRGGVSSDVSPGFSWSRDSLAFGFFALALAAIYLPLALQGLSACSLPLEHDVGFQWIPFHEFQARAQRQGFWPLWTPNVFAGMPFLAFSHTGVLYPLGWILTSWDYARAVNCFYPLHLWIAACGLYLLFRRLDSSRPAAWLAAAGVIFTGHFFYFIHFLPSTCTITWSPWLLLALLELARRGKFRYLALLVLGLGLQLLGGEVESAVYGLGFGFCFLLLLRRRQPHFSSLRLTALAIGVALALLLVLAQFLPLYEYSHHFLRARGVTFAYYHQRVLPLELATALFWPLTKVRGFEPTLADAPYLYLGLLPLFFAPLAGLGRARPTSRPLALLALAALLFAFGSLSPLDRILYHIPLLNKFGAPEHALYLFQIFLGLLTAQGLDRFLAMSPRGRRLTLILCASLAAVLFGFGHLRVVFFPGIHLVLIALAAAMFLAVFSPMRRSHALLALVLIFGGDTYAWAYRYCPRNDPKIFQAPDDSVKQMIDDAGRSGRYQFITRLGLDDPQLPHHLGFRLGFDTLDGWITVPPLRFAEFMNRIDPRAASFENGKLAHLGLNVDLRDGKFVDAKSLPLLDLLNLKFILDHHLPLKFASPAFLAFADPERVVNVSQNPPRRRGETASSRDLSMTAPALISYRLYLEPEDQLGFLVKSKSAPAMMFLDQSGLRHLLFARQGGSASVRIALDRWASQEAILSFAALDRPGSNEGMAWEDPAIFNRKLPFHQKAGAAAHPYLNWFLLYHNSEVLPRAFIAHEVEVIPEDEKLLDRLAAMPRAHLRQTLLFSKPSPGTKTLRRLSGSAYGQPPSPVDQTEDSPDKQSFHALAVRPGYLFVSNQYLPGWRAFVDGKEWPIEQADYCFRAVFLDQGEHRVTFAYQPISFRVGLWASLASLCLLMFAVVYAVATGTRFSKLTG